MSPVQQIVCLMVPSCYQYQTELSNVSAGGRFPSLPWRLQLPTLAHQADPLAESPIASKPSVTSPFIWEPARSLLIPEKPKYGEYRS